MLHELINKYRKLSDQERENYKKLLEKIGKSAHFIESGLEVLRSREKLNESRQAIIIYNEFVSGLELEADEVERDVEVESIGAITTEESAC